MYTAVSKRIYTTREAIYAENVTKCIDKARKIAKKKKAELELKLICLLLIVGNIFVLVNTGERIMNFLSKAYLNYKGRRICEANSERLKKQNNPRDRKNICRF